MIHDLKPYPAYKDSGVPWLGEVPEHWEIKKLKYTSTLHGRIGFHGLSSSEYGSDGIIVVSGSNFRDWHVDWNRCHRISEDWYEKDKNIQLRNGDLLVTKDGTIGKTAMVSELTEKAVLNSGVIVVRPKMPIQYENRYLLYLINSKVFDAFIDIKKTGATIHHLYEATFNNFSISLPQISEQSGIVRFLDYANRCIRRYIRAKQKLIKLLEEQKQAIIHQAVTRGLDPNVKLKPSGVEWLGDVPEHWKIKKVKRTFRTTSGATPNTSQQSLYYGGPIPWIRTMDLTNDLIHSYEVGITESALRETACKILPRGSVLVAMYGGAGTIGKNGLLMIEAATNQAVCGLLPSPLFDPEYVLRYMQLQRPYWMVGADGTRKDPNISQERIRESFILWPPLQEQHDIAKKIEIECKDINLLIDYTHQEISLLREYRTRLIADVATGKLDVREAAVNLPEEIEETEIFDASLSEGELESDEMEDQAGELEEEILA